MPGGQKFSQRAQQQVQKPRGRSGMCEEQHGSECGWNGVSWGWGAGGRREGDSRPNHEGLYKPS